MYVNNFTKYVYGKDIAKLQANVFTFPSKNFLLYKGVAYKRPGLVNDGIVATQNVSVNNEFLWKDQVSNNGNLLLRFWGTDMQLKINENANGWVTIYTGLSATAKMVRGATWLDSTGSIIKKRAYFVDGTENIHKWNGAKADIASGVTTTITVSGATLERQGFDTGSVTVIVVRYSAGAYVGQDEYACTGISGNTMTLSSPLVNPVNAGDLVIAKPILVTGILAGVNKDDIYTYQNQLGLASLASGQVNFSSAEIELDYVIPAPGSRTATSPYVLFLDGNYTAMISRRNVLWISTVDDWFKITKLNEINAYDQWFDIEKFEQPEQNGALPFAVASYKTDIIFMSSDKRLQRITTLELTQRDDTLLLSDDIEVLLASLNMENILIYYKGRYIYICVPQENLLLMLDMVGDPELQVSQLWQPPQTVGVTCLSFEGGVIYGHSNARNESFYLFKGKNDFGLEIEVKFAFGYIGNPNRHLLNDATVFGVDGRMNQITQAKVNHYFETDGATNTAETPIDGTKIKMYNVADDVAWAMAPWAYRAWAGADQENDPLKRFFVFDVVLDVSWFEYRPVFTVNGVDTDFHLLGWSMDNKGSDNKIDSALFVEK